MVQRRVGSKSKLEIDGFISHKAIVTFAFFTFLNVRADVKDLVCTISLEK